MKVALTIWEDRISPVFDSANMLLIAEIEDIQIIQKRYEPFYPERPLRLAKMLKSQNVNVLICGAVSQMPATKIETSGIKLIPFITGNADEVLTSYAKNSLIPGYLMPGCKKGYQCLGTQKKGVKNMPGRDGTGPKGNRQGKGMGNCPNPKSQKGSRKGQGQSKGCGRNGAKGRRGNR